MLFSAPNFTCIFYATFSPSPIFQLERLTVNFGIIDFTLTNLDKGVTYIICDNIHLYTIYISYPKTLSQAPTKRVGDRHIGEVIHLWMQALSGAHESELKGIAVIIYDYFAYYDDYLNYHRLHRRRLVQEAK
jgi:hypothetical protein